MASRLRGETSHCLVSRGWEAVCTLLGSVSHGIGGLPHTLRGIMGLWGQPQLDTGVHHPSCEAAQGFVARTEAATL